MVSLIKGLELARKEGIEELVVFGESCIVIGEERNLVRNTKSPITKTHQLLKILANESKDVNFLHILRENNTHADRMANQGVDLECRILLCDQQDQERNWIPLQRTISFVCSIFTSFCLDSLLGVSALTEQELETIKLDWKKKHKVEWT